MTVRVSQHYWLSIDPLTSSLVTKQLFVSLLQCVATEGFKKCQLKAVSESQRLHCCKVKKTQPLLHYHHSFQMSAQPVTRTQQWVAVINLSVFFFCQTTLWRSNNDLIGVRAIAENYFSCRLAGSIRTRRSHHCFVPVRRNKNKARV